jgi:glycosyltransferase involved in cell wall biosynthesis
MGYGPGKVVQGHVETSAASLVDMHKGRRPLVSVGIPTFNRPEGLRRTLRFIREQTYPNLEILVTDNASPGSETEKVATELAAIDKRITYFRQPVNLGAVANFRFALSKASGDYFMWATDDDEWDASFIETCLAADPSCSVMTNFKTIFRARNTCDENRVPELSPNLSMTENVVNFFSNMQPSLFYGLHPRKSVLFTLKGSYFDFYDCYVVLRIILESGFRTIDCTLYGAGVDTQNYEVKYANPAKRQLAFWPFFFHSSIALARCSRLSSPEKLKLWLKLLQLVRGLQRHHDARAA